jgi:uncharacterized sulfatase
LEIGLYVYYKQVGVLMGAELIIRPFSEIWTTINNSSNIFLDIISILGVLAVLISFPLVLKKVKCFRKNCFSLVSISIIIILSAGTIFYQRDRDHNINNYLESKSYYFFSAIKNYLTEEPEIDYFVVDEYGFRIEKNEDLLKEYILLFNNSNEADFEYPMERMAYEFPDVLSPFFKKSEKTPNVVIIIVESLDSYIMNDINRTVSFTPFLDSLARVGLFWKNCLSLTPRTSGVLPAIIGSVPHGMKGFQFGIMPQHHSLFTVLKNNDYYTNFFYGGDLNFDNMLDFITKQEPDHIENYLPVLQKLKKKKRANWWGAYDHTLFEESLSYLKTLSPKKPYINVYLTITTHDPFTKEDKRLKEKYEPKTKEIFSRLDDNQKKHFLQIENRMEGFTYFDDCLKNFIHNYSKQHDFENTIFIITGDHSAGVRKNKLAYYSVPVIVWSPLLKTDKVFPNIVSHQAITPTIISFLQNNYNLTTPEKLSWSSNGLDTSLVFNPSEKILFLDYERKLNTMVYNQYFFDKSDGKLYEIDENLDLERIKNNKILENIQSKFDIIKYVNHYVYHNDKLVSSKNLPKDKYKIIKSFENITTIVCITPDTIPSVSGVNMYELIPETKIKGNYAKIKIKLMADIIINDFVYQDQQMLLRFSCKGKNFKYLSKDHITKYILEEEVLCDKKYELLVEKEIDIKDIEDISVSICVGSNEKDRNWEPDKKITISNIKVLIWGK